jgi:hypothetical protein
MDCVSRARADMVSKTEVVRPAKMGFIGLCMAGSRAKSEGWLPFPYRISGTRKRGKRKTQHTSYQSIMHNPWFPH